MSVFASVLSADATRGATEYRDGYAIRYGVAINEAASVIVYWMTDEL